MFQRRGLGGVGEEIITGSKQGLVWSEFAQQTEAFQRGNEEPVLPQPRRRE